MKTLKSLFCWQLTVISLSLLTLSSPAAESAEKLKQDIRNHNQKINALISEKQFDRLQTEAQTLSDDIKALVGNASQLPERRRARVKEISSEATTLLRALEENAKATDPVAARATYKKLQLPLTALERAFSAPLVAGGGSAEGHGAVEIIQLRKDIQNHSRKLSALIQERKPEELAAEVEELQNDLDALLAEMKTEVEAIKDTAQELERNAGRGNQAEARASYKKLQAAINSSPAIQPPGLQNSQGEK